jgi:hypothetical protein
MNLPGLGALACATALALAILVPGAARADAGKEAEIRAGEPASLAYEVYFGGVRALTMQADISLTGAQFQVQLSARTRGIADWIFDWIAQASTDGSVTEGILRPGRHDSVSTLRGKRREVSLTFQPDGAITARTVPPVEEDEREPVTPEQQRGAVDPLSALLILAQDIGAGRGCDRTLPVFDGRRRYDLAFRNGGQEILKPSEYTVFSGDATLCLFNYNRIAGYQKPGERWSNPKDFERTYRTWVAPIVPGLPPLPVRIEAEGTFGTVLVHLVGIGRPRS